MKPLTAILCLCGLMAAGTGAWAEQPAEDPLFEPQDEIVREIGGEPEEPAAPGIVEDPVANAALEAILPARTNSTPLELVVSLDKPPGQLTVKANGKIVLTKVPTRFNVIEWTLHGRSSSRVAPFVTATNAPLYSEHRAVLGGQGSAKGAPGPVFEWTETWETAPGECSVSLTVSNIAREAVTVKFHAAGPVTFHRPHPPVKQDRFQRLAYHDYGDVCIVVDGPCDPIHRGGRTVPGGLVHGGFELRPGEARRQRTTFRFTAGSRADPAFNPESIFQPLHDAIAKRYPRVLHWPDRRMILPHFSALTARGFRLGYSTNPRGYTAAEDVTTPEGLARFRTKKIQEARSLVETCRKANAQGVIVWDLEGQECRHAITYCGSPDRLLPQAPEMDEVADDFFAVFFEAGVRAGICVRPQRLQLRPGRHPDIDPANQYDWRMGGNPKYFQDGSYASASGRFDEQAVIERLADKIGYAYRRWKLTLFYVDSPVIVTATIFTELARRFPDCLIIPEYAEITWYGATAPLFLVPAHARKIWPDAFGCVCTGGFAGGKATPDQIGDAVRNGCILIGNSAPQMAAFYASNAVPRWHEPAGMQWRADQPVNQALTRTLARRAQPEEKP